MKNILTNFILLFPFLLMAQVPVEGRILIQENNETYPLEGVNIFWLNTTIGTVSDQEGKFSLLPTASTNQLVIKYLGFKTAKKSSLHSVEKRLKNLI